MIPLVHEHPYTFGDTEFAAFFVALAHTADLPARRVSGYWFPEGGTLAPLAYHDWAEFYENGIWRIVDAQQRDFDTHVAERKGRRVIWDQ